MSFTIENKIQRITNNYTKQSFEVLETHPDHFLVKESSSRGRNAEPFDFYYDEILDSFRSGGITVDGFNDVDTLFAELRHCAVRAELEQEKEYRRRDNEAIDGIRSLNDSEESQ